MLASKHGGDVIEIDVICSTDSVVYAFFEGAEPENLGLDESVSTFTSAEIGELRYVWGQIQGEPVPVDLRQNLLEFLRSKEAESHMSVHGSGGNTRFLAPNEAYMDDQLFVKVPATTSALGGSSVCSRVHRPSRS